MELLLDEKLCKFCLSETTDENAVSLKNKKIIFLHDKKLIDFQKVLKSLKIQASENLNSFDLVCTQCKDIIVKFYLLKNSYDENQIILSEKSSQESPSKKHDHEIRVELFKEVEEFCDKIKDKQTFNITKHHNKLIIERVDKNYDSKFDVISKQIDPVINNDAEADEIEAEFLAYEHENDVFLVQNNKNDLNNSENEEIEENHFNDENDDDMFEEAVFEEVCEEKISIPSQRDDKTKTNELNEKSTNEYETKTSCTKYKCDECSVLFPSEDSFLKHLSYHFLRKISHLLNYYDCYYCSIAFGTQKDYDKHKTHHADDDDEYVYKFKGKPQLEGCEILPRQIVGDDIWNCGHCDMQFGSKNEINFHITLFHGNLYCPFDKQPYLKSVFYLSNHLKTKHADQFEEITFNCSFCNAAFKSQNEMNEHTKECNSKKFLCNHCDKKFFLERQLKEHLNFVNGEFKFSCSACSKMFINKAALNVHFRIHSQDKPYVCTFEGCNKAFRTNSHRSAHMDVHYEKKNFKCQFCNELFKTRGAKRIHEKSHSEDNICKLCENLFKQRSHLVRHVNSVHKIKCDSSNLEEKISFSVKS